MQVQENISLKPFNTFGIDVKGQYFTEVKSKEELIEIIKDPEFKNIPKLILGGGSNILFTKNFEGLIIHNLLKGIEIIKDDGEHVWVKAASGEVWHELVLFCIKNNLAGIENLSLIPGTVGAAPMQNIGAYGVEIKTVFDSLESMNMETGEVKVFEKEECNFGYRESIFKHEAKGKYFILSVTLKLNKTPHYNTTYGAIQQTLDKQGIKELSIKAISDAVCAIRRSKLPDPKIFGNAGSFFKNPEVEKEKYELLQKTYPEIPHYPTPSGKVKIPAGWMIEQCGWKGKKVGNTGAHKDQALCLVNYGNAEGNEVWNLALEIQRSVNEKFGIDITPEVNIV